MKKTINFLIVFLCLTGCKTKDTIEVSGTIEIRETDIASRVAGRIIKLHTDKGDSVKTGQLLAEIDDKLVNAQYDEAKAVCDQAGKDYKRAKDLYGSSSTTKQQYEQAETFYNQAKARLIQAETMKEEAKVKAPWTGVIIDKYIEEGELVSQLVPLFTIGDLKIAKLKIYVPLKEMEIIKIGDRIDVKIDAYKDKTFNGKVTYISDKAEFTPKNIQTKDERIKEVFAVEITIQNDEKIFKPGMPADAILKKK